MEEEMRRGAGLTIFAALFALLAQSITYEAIIPSSLRTELTDRVQTLGRFMQSDELRLWLSLPVTDELRIRLQQARSNHGLPINEPRKEVAATVISLSKGAI